MKKIPLLILSILTISCNIEKDSINNNKTEYLRWVGDIEYDPLKDNDGFTICNGDDKVLQYFNLGKGPIYKGEKPALLRNFENKYKPVPGKNQSGLIRIRFIVNCKGQAGRFQVLQSDLNFKETEFDKKVVSQLTEITEDIESWVILQSDNQPVDYYYYLIFKIIDGQIIEILP